jgi:hypothetical protein
MLSLDEAADVHLPNYLLVPDLNKDTLMKYCFEKPELKFFLPDTKNIDSIDRGFFCKVYILRFDS